MKVGPAGIHAPACLVRGLTDTPDFGMLEFEVHGRDPFGNMLELLPRQAPPPGSNLSFKLADVLACFRISGAQRPVQTMHQGGTRSLNEIG